MWCPIIVFECFGNPLPHIVHITFDMIRNVLSLRKNKRHNSKMFWLLSADNLQTDNVYVLRLIDRKILT